MAAYIVERVQSTVSLQIPSYLLAQSLNGFSSSVANGEEVKPGWGERAGQPSAIGSAWPRGSWEGVDLKIPIGSSSFSLWLPIRAN